jgi:hypothetical protein
MHKLTPQRESCQIMQRRDRNLTRISDLQHQRPRRLPKLTHLDYRRRLDRDTVSGKGRLLAFSDAC